METTKELIKRLVKKHGSVYAVSQASGVQEITMHMILDGRTKNPMEKTWLALKKLDRADKKEAENHG